MEEKTQPMLKSKICGPLQEVIFPEFPDDDNTVTTTVTKSRRVSFGTNFIKEFIVGSAVSANCVSEYEQAFSSSDSSNANSSHSAIESDEINEKTKIFNKVDDEMSITACDKVYILRQSKIPDDSDFMTEDSKENRMPLDLIMRQLDRDDSDSDLFNPERSFSDVLNLQSSDLTNESEKLNLNESMDISKDFHQIIVETTRERVSFTIKTHENVLVDSTISNGFNAQVFGCPAQEKRVQATPVPNETVFGRDVSMEIENFTKFHENLNTESQENLITETGESFISKNQENFNMENEENFKSETQENFSTHNEGDFVTGNQEILNIENPQNVSAENPGNLNIENTENLNTESQENVNFENLENVNAKNYENISTETQENFNTKDEENLNIEKGENFNIDTEENLNTENQENINTENQENVNAENQENLNTEIQENINTEIQENINTEIQENTNTEIQENINTENQENINAETAETEVNLDKTNMGNVLEPEQTDMEGSFTEVTANLSEPLLVDVKVIETLVEQSKEPNCLWTLQDVRYPESKILGLVSVNCTLLQSQTLIRFTLKKSKEDSMDSCSIITDSSVHLKEDSIPVHAEYSSVLRFGFKKQEEYFNERKQKITSIRYIPYFLDEINSFMTKINSYLGQVYEILTSYPGSSLRDAILSFRLFSYPIFFSCTVSIDLTHLFRLSESSLSFKHDIGHMDEKIIRSIFQECSKLKNCLCEFIIRCNKHLFDVERVTGWVSKRSHIRLLPAELRL